MSDFGIHAINRGLQAVGHFTGYPMTFVHLRRGRRCMPIVAIVNYVRRVSKDGIVCLVDEPASDVNFLPLVADLRRHGYSLHLTTDGSRDYHGYPFDWITVEPSRPDYILRSGHTLVIDFDISSARTLKARLSGFDERSHFFHRYLRPLTSKAADAAQSFLLSSANKSWALDPTSALIFPQEK